MIDSLKRSYRDEGFVFYVLALDNEVYEYLNKREPDYIVPIQLAAIEDDELRSVKSDRTLTEYYWTLTPSLVRYVMNLSRAEQVTYLDADLYFWDSPQETLRRLQRNGHSVGITPHRYTPEYNQSSTSGVYCVQFMPFSDTEEGREIVEWWRDRCIEWCYARPENGKFGDQKYLDDWATKFSSVKIMAEDGMGLAPWNIQQYQVMVNDSKKPVVVKNEDLSQWPIIFFHFHNVRFLSNDQIDLGDYRLHRDVLKNVYRPYLIHILDAERRLIAIGFDKQALRRPVIQQFTWMTYPRVLKRALKRTYNRFNLDRFIED
jgi:hypothetical protein